MLNKLLSFIREQNMIQPGDTVVCALSGGAASVQSVKYSRDMEPKPPTGSKQAFSPFLYSGKIAKTSPANAPDLIFL